MSKLYGKLWNEKMSMSTKAAHEEITAQILYGSKSDSRVAAEITVKAIDGKFILFVNTPEAERSIELEWNT